MKKAWAWFDGLHWIPKLIIIFVLLGGISNAMGSNDTAKNEQASISTTTSTTTKATTTTTEAPESAIKAIKAKVIRCIDGDTIEVEMNGKTEKVRLIGVDTPETKHPSKPVEAYGKEASDFTQSKLEGKTVFLELDVQERDKYGRVLAYVWLEEPTEISETEVREKMFNAHLLLNGYAQLLTIPPDVKYSNEYFVKYQAEARDNDKGLWAIVVTTTTEKPVITTTTQKAYTQPTEGAGGTVTVYVTNTGKKYHEGDCRYLSKSKIPISLSEAKQRYGPCSVCDPPM